MIGSRTQFLPGPPPDLTSALYGNDVNRTKAIGSVTSTTRTADQTLVARLFAVVGTTTSIPAVWVNLTRDLVRARALNGLDAARLFALVGVTAHDALLTSFSGKFQYGIWRPTTAIREADRDQNAATVADPGWLSLIPNPPYPTYPGNYACLASSATRVLARALSGSAAAEGPHHPRARPAHAAHEPTAQLFDLRADDVRSDAAGQGVQSQQPTSVFPGELSLQSDPGV